jgi:hypothetical protein
MLAKISTPKKILIAVLSVVTLLMVGWWFDLHHASVEEMTSLHGKSEAEVIAILGQPSHTDILTLQTGTTLPEMYIEVHNTYHPDNPATAGVKIKEMTWGKRGYTVSLFLHQKIGRWEVLESVRYRDGVCF